MKTLSLTMFKKLNFFSEEVNWDALNQELACIDWKNIFSDKSLNENLKSFYEKCFQIAKKFVPEKQNSNYFKKSKPERERRNLTRRRRRIHRHLIKVTSPSRKNSLNEELLDIEVKLQKSYNEKAKLSEEKAINAIKTNSKYFYSYAKKFSKIKSKIGPLQSSKNQFTNDSKEMAELLSEQFAKSFSTPVDYYSNNVTPNSIPQIEPLMFTIEDIKTAIKELRPTSASGPDGFPAILLRNCVNSLSEPLTIFWQKSIDTETIPEQLLQSIITPQHKSGSKALPINYRPIALTSHIIKVFEKVIRNHVTTHLTKNNLLNDNQHGFRSGRSCLSELLEHYDTLLSYLEEGFNVDVIYLDFAKAFDKLDRA